MTKKEVMGKMEDNDNLAGKSYLAWLFIFLVTVVMISLILPFPISLVVSLIFILFINVIRADIALKKAGMGGIRGWYKSFSSLESGRRWDMSNNHPLYRPLRFSCMMCGNVHNKTECPKCGSKAVRVE